MERATGTEVYGCGSRQSTDITLNIQTTTGGNFTISLNGKNTVEHLKKLVSKKLKVAKDRICLLHRERQLREGTLEANGVVDGARVVLLPSVETGLLSSRPENSVMQALESLNETQVNDFLSGKSPLNLTMRLGDHMMLIQLQLSTLNAAASAARTLRTSTPTKRSPSPIAYLTRQDIIDAIKSKKLSGTLPNEPQLGTDNQPPKDDKDDEEMIGWIRKSSLPEYAATNNKIDPEKEKVVEKSDTNIVEKRDTNCGTSNTPMDTEQSPITSLSNLVSTPLEESAECKEVVENQVRTSLIDLLSSNKLSSEVKTPVKGTEAPTQDISLTPDSSLSDDSDTYTEQSSFLTESTIDEYPMESLFNSVDKGLFEDEEESMMDREISNLATMSHGSQEPTGALPSFQSISEPLKTKRFQYLMHKTSKYKHQIGTMIGQNKQKAFMKSVVNKHRKRMQIKQDSGNDQPSSSRTEPFIMNSRKLILQPSTSQADDHATPSTSKETFRTPETPKKSQTQIDSQTPPVDVKDLIEASKNLTQKLKKLSKEVLTNKIDLRTAEETVRSKIGPGAVIESMKHHGKGIYSGTFSGTLNPALQDRFGRPKRDISTIIHILNDLLCASPPIVLAQKESSSSSGDEEDPGNCMGCSQPMCARGQCGDAGGARAPACRACAALISGTCGACRAARALARDNNKTKCKVEQLRLVMQQKKQRREARKSAAMPYPPPGAEHKDRIDALA